jgi:hypothetical protein
MYCKLTHRNYHIGSKQIHIEIFDELLDERHLLCNLNTYYTETGDYTFSLHISCIDDIKIIDYLLETKLAETVKIDKLIKMVGDDEHVSFVYYMKLTPLALLNVL